MKQEAIREHCKQAGIRVIESASGAVRFVGYEVDISFANWRLVRFDDLKPAKFSANGKGE